MACMDLVYRDTHVTDNQTIRTTDLSLRLGEPDGERDPPSRVSAGETPPHGRAGIP